MGGGWVSVYTCEDEVPVEVRRVCWLSLEQKLQEAVNLGNEYS